MPMYMGKVSNIKLKFKIGLFSVVLIVFISISLSILLLYRTRFIIRKEFDEKALTIAKNLAAKSELGVLVENKKILQQLTNELLLAEKDIINAEIYNKEGIVLSSKKIKGYNLIKPEYINKVSQPIEIPFEDLMEVSSPVATADEIIISEDTEVENVSKLSTAKELAEKMEVIGEIILEFNTEKTQKVIYQLSLAVAAVSFFFIVVGIIISFLFSATITRPIAELVYATEKISEGQLSYEAKIYSDDEIGILAKSFNKMTKDLKYHTDALESLTSSLEDKVKERTNELELMNEKLQESNIKIKESDRLKSEFLTRMSHELRTPLNAILGFSGILLSGIEGDLSEPVKDDVKRIENSGKHLLNLINNILDLSKIESGKMELHKEYVDIKDIIQEVISTTVSLVKEKGLDIKEEIDQDIPLIFVDKTRISQVIMNLISNAIKFTEAGYITVQARNREKEILLSISDTGIGIAEENIKKVFEEFSELAGVSGRYISSTGLGMAISKKFIEMHGGNIWVESIVGEGSTFHFTIPLAEQKIEDKAIEEEKDIYEEGPAVTTKLKTVLIVDDDPQVVSLYNRYLEKEGYKTIDVQLPEKVLETAKTVIPDVIILDILMPQRSGWEIIEELKKSPVTNKIPVIICSIVDEKNRGFALGATAYLIKPITKGELITVLNKIEQKMKNILIVDDNENDVKLIGKMLQPEGYQIYSAYSGEEGIKKIKAMPPDLIILDLMMPRVDGFAVIEELRSHKSLRHIPVIIITAKGLSEANIGEFQDNVKKLFHKGYFTKGELVNSVIQILKGFGDG